MLEVRLLYRKLDNHNKVLEQTVLERTAELRASEARFQRFTELSSDWYWEQDAEGKLTQSSGPVREMLGHRRGGAAGSRAGIRRSARSSTTTSPIASPSSTSIYSRTQADGSIQYLQVSGEPMFDGASRFTGFRGVGMDVTERMQRAA